jgi:probable F420-dependent oxidoreductase
MMQGRPFRFGVLVERFGTREELVATARKAEQAGYATFLIRDHFIAEPFGHQFAPLTTLATVAAVTERLRVGTLVFDNDYRHPAVLAKEAATLDLLSGGRLELGLGAGWAREEYEQAGIPFDPPGTRVDRFAEALRVLKGLFADGPLSFSGRHYRIAGLDSFPKPVQRPHPPLLVGAGGRRMLRIAAREADIVGVLTAPIAGGVLTDDPASRLSASIAQKVEWVREAAGERFGALELSMVISVVIAPDRRRAAEQFAARRDWRGVAAEEVLAMPSVFIGTVDQIAEEMHARRERYGFSYLVVPDRSLDAAAPLVARLAGQ